jgi:hypothetical protein
MMDTLSTAWPLAEPLDAYLREIVQTLHQASEQGIRNVTARPAAGDRALTDCTEILDVILHGDVQEWLGA